MVIGNFVEAGKMSLKSPLGPVKVPKVVPLTVTETEANDSLSDAPFTFPETATFWAKTIAGSIKNRNTAQ